MPTEYEIYKFFRKNAMPRSTDILIQGLLIVMFLAVVSSIDFGVGNFRSEQAPVWSLWLVIIVPLWWMQNYFFGKILMRRARRVEASFEQLPEGLYQKLVKVSAPHEFDMSYQYVGVLIFVALYSPDWFSFLPASASTYAWIVVFLAAWQLHHIVLINALRERLFSTFFRNMYYEMRKTATA